MSFQVTLIVQCAALCLGSAVGMGALLRGRSVDRPSIAWSIVPTLGLVAATVLSIRSRAFFEAHVRQMLFIRAEPIGWWFERKEHLVFAAGALGCSLVCAALLELGMSPRDARAFRETVTWIRTATVVVALLASTLSIFATVQILRMGLA